MKEPDPDERADNLITIILLAFSAACGFIAQLLSQNTKP